MVARDTAALASSIFIVARKRTDERIGSYETEVRAELEQIIRERVATLWEMGVTGADLVIAAVGAGLKAFTRFERVEYANGDEVPASRFLTEVEGVVLEVLLGRIFGVSAAGVEGIDGSSRFYVLWRYAYLAAEIDAGEAIVFSYAQPVELEGIHGLASGSNPLVEKKKAKCRLRDFAERGADARLGLPDEMGRAAPLIDVLHRVLWIMERAPRDLPAFFEKAKPDLERLRLVAQAVAGASLEGSSRDAQKPLVATTAVEQVALDKLLTNWRSLIERRAPRGPTVQAELFGEMGGGGG